MSIDRDYFSQQPPLFDIIVVVSATASHLPRGTTTELMSHSTKKVRLRCDLVKVLESTSFQ